jgi:hypothetical protein
MPKQLVYRGKSLANAVDPGLLGMIFVGILGLGLLTAEGAVLSAQGIPGVAYALTAVFVASTVSSIAGFAFSALCGALLFHLMDSPVYVVHVMLLCSIAMQLLSVASLWRAIDWRSLRVFLVGGFLGVPVGVYLLLPTGTYRNVIGSLLIAYGGYLLLRPPVRTFRIGPLSDACAGFLGGITGGLAGLSRRDRRHLVRHEGVGQGTSARRVSAVHSQHAAADADRNLPDATVIAGASAIGLEGVCLRSGRPARRLVRTAHLQTALGSAVRTRGQCVAHPVRHRSHPLNDLNSHQVRTRKMQGTTRQPPNRGRRLHRVRR